MSPARVFRNALFMVIVCAGLGFGAAGFVMAADMEPQKFFGRYQGAGITQNPNTIYFGFDNRDLDVEIGPDGENSFYVEWTTVIRDFADRETRRKTGRITFDPSERPGIYVAREAAAGLANGMSWASIRENILSVRVLAILDDGTYVLQTYDRTLNEDGDMFLYFRSDRDGGTIRFVTARLEKVE